MNSMFTAQPLSMQYWTCLRDLLVGQIGQEGEAALGHAHVVVSSIQAARRRSGTKSGVSVEA